MSEDFSFNTTPSPPDIMDGHSDLTPSLEPATTVPESVTVPVSPKTKLPLPPPMLPRMIVSDGTAQVTTSAAQAGSDFPLADTDQGAVEAEAAASVLPDADEALPDGDLAGEHVPVAERPTTLLDLPDDILQLILAELDHANDLSAIACTCSNLYSLSIPRLYSRFDIVWPDTDLPHSSTKGVDALTYGLTTLCLGSTFARSAGQLREAMSRRRTSGKGRLRRESSHDQSARNFDSLCYDYASYTREFFIRNGPPNQTMDYVITKQKGKMLGTLAALSIARMPHLESFVWDMPTGVLSDVFMALGSLTDYDPEHGECRLERMWVRWHDSGTSSSRFPRPLPRGVRRRGAAPRGSSLAAVRPPDSRPTVPYSASTAEFPTFSVLPPLKSLSVLDIDQLSYLDELSVLVEKSYTRLEDLRIGIASHATHSDFVQIWDEPGLKQVDLDASWPGESIIGDRRLGGVLGILVGRIFDLGNIGQMMQGEETAELSAATVNTDNVTEAASSGAADVEMTPTPMADAASTPSGSGSFGAERTGNTPGCEAKDSYETDGEEGVLDKKLKPTTLALERVPLSVPVMVHAFDWSMLTSLTILSCKQYDSLWRELGKHFRPTPVASSSRGNWSRPAKHGVPSGAKLHYPLALKIIRTDTVRKPLLSFIKETLRPNSLEGLFLHQRHGCITQPLPIEEVFRYAVKPHCASLQNLLIEGEHQKDFANMNFHRNSRAWNMKRATVRFLTSGQMRELRELSVSIAYRDWHMFLQGLPNLAKLRALHIQNISDHITGAYSRYESAMQVADVVTLRPEMKLTYLAIAARCFEFGESSKMGHCSHGFGGDGSSTPRTTRSSRSSNAMSDVSLSESDFDQSVDEDDDDDDDDNDGTNEDGIEADDGSDGLLSMVPQEPQIHMLEMSFSDCSAAIIRARIGQL